MNVPANWYPPRSLEKRWEAIVVHHSGTPNGNLAIFDRWHREGNHWEGVGYDFVIGNGTDSGDGRIEVTFRWDQQKVGAHCKTPGNWANEHTIGICLVGDFDHAPPTRQQVVSLAKLVSFLCARYRISSDLIYGHNTTPGARVTQCPGAAFPFADLYALLERRS
ncbi:MAG: N-acetylmuramoyl-L-alanine amidase [Planctomycetes bacterium]|nr:N-acetylmuramoyl-L-alanine amidase [Planctomycetota bacterium]